MSIETSRLGNVVKKIEKDLAEALRLTRKLKFTSYERQLEHIISKVEIISDGLERAAR